MRIESLLWLLLNVSDAEAIEDEESHSESQARAYFAGGCFWCIEAAFSDLEDVKEVKPGYIGGEPENADYSKVSTGKTDHRESVMVVYDPSEVSYAELLDVFWRNIDPGDDGGQFADRGPQYTTAIFPVNEEQRMEAERSKKELEQSKRIEGEVATEIEDFDGFYPAEEEHHDYAERKSLRYRAYVRGSGRKKRLREIWEDDS